jgi:hypothetical protein
MNLAPAVVLIFIFCTLDLITFGKVDIKLLLHLSAWNSADIVKDNILYLKSICTVNGDIFMALKAGKFVVFESAPIKLHVVINSFKWTTY